MAFFLEATFLGVLLFGRTLGAPLGALLAALHGGAGDADVLLLDHVGQ